jgi:hypothetical protein
MAAYDLVHCPSCSLRMFRDPVHLSDRVPLPPSNPQCITAKLARHRTMIIAAARARQNSAFFSTLLVLRRIQMIQCRVSYCVFPEKAGTHEGQIA